MIEFSSSRIQSMRKIMSEARWPFFSTISTAIICTPPSKSHISVLSFWFHSYCCQWFSEFRAQYLSMYFPWFPVSWLFPTFIELPALVLPRASYFPSGLFSGFTSCPSWSSQSFFCSWQIASFFRFVGLFMREVVRPVKNCEWVFIHSFSWAPLFI